MIKRSRTSWMFITGSCKVRLDALFLADSFHVPMCKNPRLRHSRGAILIWTGTFLCSGWCYTSLHERDQRYRLVASRVSKVLSGEQYCSVGSATTSWLVSSVSRPLHRYCRGRGFDCRTSLIFFNSLSSVLLK